VKFTPSGSVRVHASLAAGTPDPAGTSAGQVELTVSVRDSGPGLTTADLALLFRPYAQGEEGRRAQHGAGLGLAISQQIVQALQGRLTAQDLPPSQGAGFLLWVPLQLAPAQAGAEDAVRAASTAPAASAESTQPSGGSVGAT
jgi:two-component system, NarL family, sensor histidine kinase EvgS